MDLRLNVRNDVWYNTLKFKAIISPVDIEGIYNYLIMLKHEDLGLGWRLIAISGQSFIDEK